MSYSHLENKLKGLSHYESEVDTAEVWKALEPKINAQDSKRKLFYFRFFGYSLLMLVILMASFTFLRHQNTETNWQDVNFETTITQTNEIKTSNYIAVQNDTDSFIVDENKSANLLLAKTETDLYKTQFKKKNTNQQRKLNTGFLQGEISKESPLVNNPSDDNIYALIDKNSETFESNNLVGLENVSSSGKAQFNDQTFEKSNTSATIFIPTIDKIYASQLSSVLVKTSDLLTTTPVIEECPLINKESSKLSFSIRPYADYDIPMTSLFGRGADTNLETIRNSVESNYIGYSFGVELRAKTRSGFHVFTGYNQSLIRDRFDFSIEKDTMILLEDIIKNITINENQDSVITIGDSLVNARVIETGRKFANYKSIDIPIGFEFSKRVSKMELGISATALFNLTFGTTGSVYDENEEISSLHGKYKNSIGARFRFSTPIQYYLGRKLNIGFAPAFTYSPKSISSISYPIEHKVNLFSMRLFVDYSF